ncbi:MAG: hypothetical protein K2Q01_08425, partial [Rickettsiales bacterium]|nr:hypothetical protein [Rickettsiales bacterium]
MRRKGVQMHAISKEFIVRPEDEQALLRAGIGNAERAYDNMMQMAAKVGAQVAKMPEPEREKVLRAAGMTMDSKRIGALLEGAKPHLQALANFFILAHGVRSHPEIDTEAAMNTLLEAAGRQDRRIVVQSREDAAITTYSLFTRLVGQGVDSMASAPRIGQLCDRVVAPADL